MNTSIPSSKKPRLYGIIPGKRELLHDELEPLIPLEMQVIWPCLLQRSGVLDQPAVSFDLEFSGHTARVFFSFGGRLIATGAVAMQPGLQAEELWRWICGSMSEPDCALDRPFPTIPVWAAIAFPPPPLPASRETIFEVYRFMGFLASAIIEWTNRQN